MGNDGGSIPRRAELVKTRKAPARADTDAVASAATAAAWRSCALSRDPLAPPVVICNYGRLYNRSAILELLINRAAFPDADLICPHIKSIKDVVTLNLTSAVPPNTTNIDITGSIPLSTSSSTLDTPTDMTHPSQFICPITQKEMNGKLKFIVLMTCGCVMSHQALQQLVSSTCLVCSTPFSVRDDVVVVNAVGREDCDANALRADALKVKDADRKKAKRAEKEAKRAAASAAAALAAADVFVASDALASAALAASEASATAFAASDAHGDPKDTSAARTDNDNNIGDIPDTLDKKRNPKRKTNSSSDTGSVKRQASSSSSSSKTGSINAPLPGVANAIKAAAAASNRPVSDAIQSLYVKKDKDGRPITQHEGHFLIRGTFNRYAAGC